MTCTCVKCSACKGTGYYRVDHHGRYTEGIDDTFDMENCELCYGGYAEICEECAEADRKEHEEELAREEEDALHPEWRCPPRE